MKLIKLAALATIMVCGAAFADEVEKKVELKVVVAGDGAGDASEIHWVSRDADLDDLEVGETRTLTGESGQEVTVTRTEDGMQFKVAGETIVVPDVGAHGTHMAFIGADGEHEEVDVEVIGMDGEEVDVRVIGGGAHMMRAHHPDGVTIISAEPLDESVKESIRSVLISAGHEDEVVFIDGSEGGGRHVKVIKKRIETIK